MARPPARPIPRPIDGRRVNSRRGATESVRTAAVWVIERTLASQSPMDTFLAGMLERFDERDQRLLREIVLGTLRWMRRLDAVIEAASSRKFAAIETDIQTILRVAVYQLLFLERVAAHAIVDEAVEQAHQRTHRGAASFANAVLRRLARARDLEAWPVEAEDPVERLALEFSHPTFLVAGWVDQFGWERTRALVETNNRPRPFHVLAFADRGGRYELAERLIDEGVLVEPSLRSLAGLIVREGNPLHTRAFAAGDLYLADEVGQVVSWLPLPVAGERVYDVAAAPGGKSFALLAREPSVAIVAADADLDRLLVMRANAQRLGRKVTLVVADARQPPLLPARRDRVLADLPCSGTGTLRKHPEIKWRLTATEIERQARRGLGILRSSADLVAPGGVLVASTCSLEAVENQDVVARFLAERDDFVLEPLADHVDAANADGVVGPGLWQLLPAADHDGFTAHVLRRRGSS